MLWRASTDPSQRLTATSTHVIEWRARNRFLDDIAALELWQGNLSSRMDLVGPDGPERLRGSFASRNLFRILGVQAMLGRTFVDDDADDVVILSHGLWQRRFGADPTIVGQQIDLTVGNRGRRVRPFTIVGVLPRTFRFTYPAGTELWAPLTSDALTTPNFILKYTVVARLRSGVSLDNARADMSAVASDMGSELGGRFANTDVWVQPIHEYAVGEVRQALVLLGAATAFVVLIACLNVANLLLAATVARRRELAMRAALGASRSHLLRHLLSESLLLASLGGALGLALALGMLPVIRAMVPLSVPRANEISADLVLLGWSVVVSVLTGLVAGIVPGWRGSGTDPNSELCQSGPPSTGGVATDRWRQALTVIQVGAVLVLLIGGGLLVRSFWNLRSVDLGFDAARVITMEMRLLGRGPRRVAAFTDELLIRVRDLPGVAAASVTSSVPLRGVDFRRRLSVPGGGDGIVANERYVDADYFRVMRIPVLAGRGFSPAGTTSPRPVAVVSESLARLMFRGQSPIGQHIYLYPSGLIPTEIIGVVGDVRHVGVAETAGPAYYVPRTQASSEVVCLVVRASADAENLAPTIRNIVRSIDPAQPIQGTTTLDRLVFDSIADRRFYAVATFAFALIALFLAGFGLYGMVTHSVVERVREIGIRLALGAQPSSLVTLLLRQTLGPVVLGVLLGCLAAFWTTRLMRQYLYGVQAIDPLTYLVVAALVIVTCLAVSYIPARRAARLDPMTALRTD